MSMQQDTPRRPQFSSSTLPYRHSPLLDTLEQDNDARETLSTQMTNSFGKSRSYWAAHLGEDD